MKKKIYFKPVTEIVEIDEREELLTGSPIKVETGGDDDDDDDFIIAK
jgi:hypothetical protein